MEVKEDESEKSNVLDEGVSPRFELSSGLSHDLSIAVRLARASAISGDTHCPYRLR